MKDFDRILIVDWSASASPSPRKPRKDAIWLYEAGTDPLGPVYCRTRAAAMEIVASRCEHALKQGARLMIGWDFPMGYPAGFAQALTGQDSALAVWAHLASVIRDAPDNSNNRFEVAAAINRAMPDDGPFWGCPRGHSYDGLHMKDTRQTKAFPERRAVEMRMRSAQPCWKLFTTGSVGSQALLGLARLHALRERFGAAMAVWPFEDATTAPLVLAEIYPSIVDASVNTQLAVQPDRIKDAVQVKTLARAFWALQRQGALADAFAMADAPDLAEEGWILGVGVEDRLRAAAEGAA